MTPTSQFNGTNLFRYIDDHQQNRIGQLLTPGNGAFGTPDPQWNVLMPDESSQGGPYDWITYLGQMGRSIKPKCTRTQRTAMYTQIHLRASTPGQPMARMEASSSLTGTALSGR